MGYLLKPLTAKLFKMKFYPFVSCWRDLQLKVSENYSDLTNEKSLQTNEYIRDWRDWAWLQS